MKRPCPVLNSYHINAADSCSLRTMQEPCNWTPDYDSGAWETDCGETYCFEAEGPEANHYRFCPGCGHPLQEAK